MLNVHSQMLKPRYARFSGSALSSLTAAMSHEDKNGVIDISLSHFISFFSPPFLDQVDCGK